MGAVLLGPSRREDGLNLRLAFGAFVVWLSVLAVVGRLGLAWYDAGSPIGLMTWVAALYVFYLSLCCTFFPAPTAWIVMLMASDYLAQAIGLGVSPVVRLIVVATLGAIGTATANLNEYHLLTFVLRYRQAAAIRRTRLYALAERWFTVAPFWVLTLFSLVPIPVDVVRWLAVAARYPRVRFYFAYFLGRWVRYAVLAASAIGLGLEPWHIMLVQAVLVLAAAVRFIPALTRHVRNGGHGSDEADDAAQATGAVSPVSTGVSTGDGSCSDG